MIKIGSARISENGTIYGISGDQKQTSTEDMSGEVSQQPHSDEYWADVKGFEGAYKVSSYGRVYSCERRDTRGHLLKGKMLSPKSPGTHGYYVVNLMCRGKKRLAVPVHRLVAESLIDNPRNVDYVNHIDGNKLNNHVDNLEWVTNGENVRHAVKNGLTTHHLYARCGESHPEHKVTDEQVAEIRRLYAEGKYKSPALAKMFNLSKAHVCKILKNQMRIHESEVWLCRSI